MSGTAHQGAFGRRRRGGRRSAASDAFPPVCTRTRPNPCPKRGLEEKRVPRGPEAVMASAAPRAQSAALWQVRHGFAELTLQVQMLALGTPLIQTTRGFCFRSADTPLVAEQHAQAQPPFVLFFPTKNIPDL